MADKRRTYGQFETPPDVADLLLGFCIRRPTDRILDPSCGTGQILRRAALYQEHLAPRRATQSTLWGIEVDDQAAGMAQGSLDKANIIEGNFFELEPDPNDFFDVIVGNPPYTRAEWIGHLSGAEQPARQLVMFPEEGEITSKSPARSDRKRHAVPEDVLNRRAGLHAHFIIHATGFLRDGGRLGFVVPNGWLDVAYGERLKQFLQDHYKIVAIIESGVERWFHQASVNTCLLVLEKWDPVQDRENNRVRLIRLRRPLSEIIPLPLDSQERPTHLERLTARLMPRANSESSEAIIRVMAQAKLEPANRWGVALRASPVYRRHFRDPGLVPLGSWANVQRGFTSGANRFFYLDQDALGQWEIESSYLRPLLKSLRHVRSRRVAFEQCQHQALVVPPFSDLSSSSVRHYIKWGEEQGFHRRRTTAARSPWYSLPEQVPADLVIPKGIWARHGAPILADPLAIDQQLYGIYLQEGTPLLVAAALLNSAWCALQLELNGRVNFGEGVLWMAAYEVEQIRLPDPRSLSSASRERITDVFLALLEEPVAAIEQQYESPAWQALNEVVFSLTGFSPEEGRGLQRSLVEQVVSRRLKARKP